jgi:hypothetical protein
VRWKDDPTAAPSGAAQALHSYGEQRASAAERQQLQERLAPLLGTAGARGSASSNAARALLDKPRVIAVLITVLVVVASALWWTRSHQPQPAAVAHEPVASSARTAQLPAAGTARDVAPDMRSIPTDARAADDQLTTQPTVRKPVAERGAVPAKPKQQARTRPQPPAAEPVLSPERELELLRKAQQSLSRAPLTTETFLAEHVRDYPQGVFEQEREMLRIEVALARSQRVRARELAQAFLTRFAGSTYQRQLEALLAADSARENPPSADTQSMDTNAGEHHALGISH